jgi:hypothetical protein
MSQTTTTRTQRPQHPDVPRPLQPAEILINLIVTLLTPMFLTGAGGDLTYARMAAFETIQAYRAETNADLIVAAKIIAFGLAALGSLCLSMADDLPISMVLRLRANANACSRSEEKNRRALQQTRFESETAPLQQPRPAPQMAPPPPAPEPAPEIEPEPEISEAALLASVVETQKRTAKHLATFTHPASQATAGTDEQHRNAMWAASAASVAAETAATLPNLPPEERRAALIWIAATSDAANDFLTGDTGPRLRPGDLGGFARPSRTP